MTRNGNVPQQWGVILGDTELQFATIAEADGAQVQFAKELGYAQQIIAASDTLQKCGPESVKAAFLNVAGMGLSLNPAMKLAYLVPRKGACCLDISYIGLLHVATESGSVVAAKAEIVCATDYFEYHGPFQAPLHQYDPFATNEARGDIIGVYCMARLQDGTPIVDAMNREMLNQIRAASKGQRDDNPWNTWYEEMCKKSIIKRAYKTWPQRPRMSKTIAYLNEQEGSAPLDVTPARPVLRHDPTQVARDAMAVEASPEADDLLRMLEDGVRQGGTAWYTGCWKALSPQQRAWVGKEHHERLWTLAQQIDQARGNA